MPVEYLTSDANSRIRLIKALRDRKKIRHEERLFLLEGPRFIEDALAYESPVVRVFAESRASEVDVAAIDGSILVVPDDLFRRISDTSTPQGELAVFPIPECATDPNKVPLIVVADGIQDPGNLGTIIRSAAAMGATQVVCARGTVDPWSPKVARAAAAAMFQIAITTGRTLIDAIAGTEVRITSGNAELRIQDVDWTLPSTLVVGNEANGVGADWSDLDTEAVSIPMAGDVESLNAGVAASIVLYEALRQRTA